MNTVTPNVANLRGTDVPGLKAAQSDARQEFLRWRDFLLLHRNDYATAYRLFEWPRLTHFNWALDYFDDLAKGNHQPALQIVFDTGVESATFAELSEESNKAANYLRRQGVKRLDRILVMLGNERALWVATLAAIKLGATIIPTSLLLTANDLADRMARGDVKHIIATQDQTEKFAHFSPVISRICVGVVDGWLPFQDSLLEDPVFTPDGLTAVNDPLFLYFTSGTTAEPKLVMHSHLSYPVGALSTMYWIGLTPGDLHLNISSPGWGKHAWSSFFAPWNAGATIMAVNQPRFSAKSVLAILRDYSVTTFCAPPTVWRMIVQEDFSSYRIHLREAVSAGEMLNPEIIQQICATWHVTVRDGYGQTETTAQIGNPPGETPVAGSVGWPLPGYKTFPVDDEGNLASEGEVAISLDPRPAGLMLGYVQENGTILAPEGEAYRTGDLVSASPDGRLTLVGRVDDVFKASDYRISPFELENILIEHAAVAEAAVVPSPDPIRTSVPKAFIALASGYEPTAELACDLFRHASERLSPFKRIRKLQFCELPKTTSGKIIRAQLRKQEMDGSPNLDSEFRETDFPELKNPTKTVVHKENLRAMETQSRIVFEARPDAYWIRINRPASMNAFDQQTLTEWNAALKSITDKSRPLVITGTGRAFCAGGDLKKYLSRLDDIEGLRAYFDLLEEVFLQIAEYPGPTIAAINGFAVAGGIEVVCLCDLAIASHSAQLADGHINYGLHPAGGSSSTLTWLIGERRAKWLLLTGDFISSTEAECIGLVNRVVPDDQLEAEVEKLSQTLGKHSPISIAAIKRLMSRDVRTVLRAEKEAILKHFQHPETRVRLERFARKNDARKRTNV